jgi:hypothetical protein
MQLIELRIEFYNPWLFNSYQHQKNSYFARIKVGKNLPTSFSRTDFATSILT